MISGHNRKRGGNGPVNWTTTLGLVVHAAADGIALGAAAATNELDVEIIIFLAIMLHKVPFIYYVSTCITQNLISLPNFSLKLGFSFKTVEFSFHFDEIFMLQLQISIKDEKMIKKFVKMLWLLKEKCLRNI